MLRPFELFIAIKHLRSKNRSRFVSFISLISVVGIALSVATLIVVLSVMNGFEQEVRERILAVVPHGTITGSGDRIEDWQALQSTAEAQPGVEAAAPFVTGQGMLVSPDGVAGVQLRGVLPAAETRVSGVGGLIDEGVLARLESRAYRIVLGQELASRLGAKVGDRLILMTTQGTVTPAGLMPRMRRFEVAGIFYAGMYEFDRSLAYIHLEDASRLMGLGIGVSGVSLSVEDPLSAADLVRASARAHGGGVYISDWTREHANFFRSIELTKSIIFVILLLVVAVAAFNIVSTLVMVVREKSAEIAILRSMGVSSGSVLLIFIAEGTLIGMVGTFIGLVVGVALASNVGPIVGFVEGILGMQFVAPDVYFISTLPSDVQLDDIVRICSVAFLLAVFATVYPALRAAATNPSTALRHE